MKHVFSYMNFIIDIYILARFVVRLDIGLDLSAWHIVCVAVLLKSKFI